MQQGLQHPQDPEVCLVLQTRLRKLRHRTIRSKVLLRRLCSLIFSGRRGWSEWRVIVRSYVMNLIERPRRLRRTEAIRALVRETKLSPDDFVYPLFVCEGEGIRREISSMPGVFNLSIDELVNEVAVARKAGVRSVILFGVPDEKDPIGSQAYAEDGITQRAI